eukprot:CAMPEP_0178961476 /NCGR_PEP_ID=MMETSP0789-20121207/13729_1 /TAXON_ID=3005 /ORGANISM="Rhizosolenia setigera, Strain CCMP 1694" /LENGTH=326 /DNA_ID=CAMNT_0020645317 /DNA_START=193 /DNA_END=1173 /DNA_ORIENTATION=-
MVESISKNRKRQRLMVLSSYVSPPRPDLPATFESLNNDTLSKTLEFVGGKSYKSFGGINKQCREVYLNTPGMTKETFLYGYGSLAAIKDEASKITLHENYEVSDYELFYPVGKGVVYHNRRDVFEWALQERKYDVLNGICQIAGEEGRINLLDEVLNKVKDWDEDDTEDILEEIFYFVDISAAFRGKLSVLKWYHTKGLLFNVSLCADHAARIGHLDIIQWLQEEEDLELRGGFYYYAVCGGQLHILKWLRERQVPWSGWTFASAAEKGNMNILQWLHDEGCPWPEDNGEDYYHRVCEGDLKPGVVDWLRANGYGDRIIFEDNDDF